MPPVTRSAAQQVVTPGGTLLTQLQYALRDLIYQHGRIQPSEVDVRFDLPVREWVESLTRPTISIYLFDLHENMEQRINGAVTPPVREGQRAVARMPLRRFEMQFMVTVLTTNIEDEYALLWRTLNTLLRFPTIPTAALGEELRAIEPPLTLKVGRMVEGAHPMAIWSALEMPPRPSLLVAVTLPMERDELFEVPLVLGRELRSVRPSPDREAAGLGLGQHGNALAGTFTSIGGTVRSPDGAPLAGATLAIEGRANTLTTDAEGRYTIGSVRPGTLTLTIHPAGGTSHPASISIPSESYDIVVG